MFAAELDENVYNWGSMIDPLSDPHKQIKEIKEGEEVNHRYRKEFHVYQLNFEGVDFL